MKNVKMDFIKLGNAKLGNAKLITLNWKLKMVCTSKNDEKHKLTHSYTQTSKFSNNTNAYIVVCVLCCMVERTNPSFKHVWLLLL